jgi:catechol 2,3-dioxygenase-like lactoylglutathione lyase family enzyme
VSGYLEHANIAVRDLDETLAFLQTALPEWKVRGRGTSPHGPWLHLGTEQSYVAIEEACQDLVGPREPYADPGLNHLGFVVADAEAVAERLRRAGYREGFQAESHPHRRRLYFLDRDGNEYEFVEYTSSDPAERNDYSS